MVEKVMINFSVSNLHFFTLQEKTHECPECQRTFRHKGNLIRHMALHDPESTEQVMIKLFSLKCLFFIFKVSALTMNRNGKFDLNTEILNLNNEIIAYHAIFL